MDLSTIFKILMQDNFLPYDGSCSSQKYREIMNKYPELKNVLEEQLRENELWVEKAKHTSVYYILADDRWKTKTKEVNPRLQLKLVGILNSPVISITL